MTKKIVYSEDAKKTLQKGMSILARSVGVTLGPKGKNVVLECKSAMPCIVNDGVTIAKAIELKNELENVGISLIRQAALKTNDVVGDGTTTATVLAYAMVEEGMKNIVAGSNSMLIKKGIEKAIHFVISKISEYSRAVVDISDIVNVAAISAGNDMVVGNIIADAMKQVGREGMLSVEEGHSAQTYLEIVEGMKFDKGFISPYFLPNNSIEICQKNPLILLTDSKITLARQELVPILEQVAATNRELLIVAEDIEKEALATLIINKLKGIVSVVAVRAPGFGDNKKAFLEDMAVLTGAQVIYKYLGLELDLTSFNMMGSAKRVVISKDTTTIISEDKMGKSVKGRCDQIRKQIDASDNSYEKEKLQQRLSKLSNGVAVIKVGSVTETEMKDKKLRFEDAINATKAAIEEGIVPGGGSTLVHLSQKLGLWSSQHLLFEELIGARIVQKALSVPLFTIVQNAGGNGSVIVEKILETSFETGYDANKSIIVNMYDAGIIDPAKVTRLVLQNASSIALMILSTECIISDKLVQ